MSGRRGFRPTDNMRELLAAMQQHDYACTITDACRTVGINRRTYYKWFDRPAFVTWWTEQQERHFALAAGRVQAATLKAATTDDAPGSATDRKLFLERFDARFAKRGKPSPVDEDLHTFEQELAAIEAAASQDTEPQAPDKAPAARPQRRRRRASNAPSQPDPPSKSGDEG